MYQHHCNVVWETRNLEFCTNLFQGLISYNHSHCLHNDSFFFCNVSLAHGTQDPLNYRRQFFEEFMVIAWVSGLNLNKTPRFKLSLCSQWELFSENGEKGGRRVQRMYIRTPPVSRVPMELPHLQSAQWHFRMTEDMHHNVHRNSFVVMWQSSGTEHLTHKSQFKGKRRFWLKCLAKNCRTFANWERPGILEGFKSRSWSIKW